MKQIDATIRHETLENVRERLINIGMEGLTVADVVGFGRQKGHTDCFRGCEFRVDFYPKLLLTIIARDEQVEEILSAVAGGA